VPAFAPSIAIVYAADGSVTSAAENGIPTTYVYNADGTVHTEMRIGFVRTWAYDSNGGHLMDVVTFGAAKAGANKRIRQTARLSRGGALPARLVTTSSAASTSTGTATGPISSRATQVCCRMH
jgi:hypothetical protein